MTKNIKLIYIKNILNLSIVHIKLFNKFELHINVASKFGTNALVCYCKPMWNLSKCDCNKKHKEVLTKQVILHKQSQGSWHNFRKVIHNASLKKIGQTQSFFKNLAKTFDTAGGGDILNSEKQNESFALKLWLSTIS